MRKIREILRLKWVAQRSHRETARSVGVSPGAVGSIVGRAVACGLAWARVEALSDEALERTLYGAPAGEGERPEPAPRKRKDAPSATSDKPAAAEGPFGKLRRWFGAS